MTGCEKWGGGQRKAAEAARLGQRQPATPAPMLRNSKSRDPLAAARNKRWTAQFVVAQQLDTVRSEISN